MARKIELKIREAPPEPLKVALKALAEERNVSKEKLVEYIKEILKETAKEILGKGKGEYEVEFDPDKEEFLLLKKKVIVEEVKDPEVEMSLEEARKIDPEAEPGDEAYEPISFSKLGRRGAQRAKNLLEMRLSGAVEESIYSEFTAKKGQLISGIVKKIEIDRIRRKKIIYVDLGKNIMGVLPPDEALPQDNRLREGDSIKAVIKDVRKTEKGRILRTEIILSRADKKFVEEILKKNISELEQGIVKIKNIARKPGVRTKVLVYSDDPNIDPVGTCVGVRGMRIRNIVQELGGERVDIIPWTHDVQKLIANALTVPKVTTTMIKRSDSIKEAVVVVPDDNLAVAIGRGGVNVKLASELIGFKINVRSESERERFKEVLPDFYKDLGVGEKQAQIMWDAGFRTIEDIAVSSFEKIKEVPGITEAEAKLIWTKAREVYFDLLRKERAKQSEKEEGIAEKKGKEEGEEKEKKEGKVEMESQELKAEESRPEEEKQTEDKPKES